MLASLFLSGVTVVLPMEASARGTEVTLGEIAELRGDDAAEVARVAAVDLGYAPSPGFSRLLHAHRIAEELGRALPDVDVRFAGQTACRVRPEVETVGTDAIAAAVRAELERLYDGQDVTFAASQNLQPADVPLGTRPAELRVRVTDPLSSSGLVPVPVQVLVDGVPYKTLWTTWQAERWATMPVLARPLRSGETIQPFHLEPRRVKVQTGRAKALPASMLTGAVAARDLASGAPVTESDVHRPTVVQLGDTVTLEVRKGAVSARTSATALASASVGDRVRVRSLIGGQEHHALVVSRDVVRIDLGR
jgi:flagella basal body P-ring formation protein FlgA